MTTPCRSALSLAIPLLLLAAASWAGPADLPGWHLIWNDEFDGASIDTAKWRVEDAALVKNNELEYYSPEDIFLSNGMLVVRSQKRAMKGRDYTSGLVETHGKFAALYGRFEFRAKLPKGQGLWPAIWMLPDDGTWPPEIDIMEIVGSQPNDLVMTFHYGHWPDHEWDTDSYMSDGADFSQDFHVYGLQWEPGALRWYIDGKERFNVTNHVPDKPFYLIINTAIGGDFPGDPDETTRWPQQMLVDYARAYGKEIPGTFFLTVGADRGRITISPMKDRYKKGEAVALKVIPFIGYRFTGWSGSSQETNGDLTLIMNDHKHLQATFAADTNAPVLLSQGKPAKGSSVEQKDDLDLRAQNAFDGEHGTRWSSKFSDPQWISVDLGEKKSIEAFRIEWENAYGKSYSVDASDDGKQWTTLYSTTNGQGRTEEIWVKGAGRYVRMMCRKRATDWGCSVFEFQVFGRSAPRPTP